MRTLTIPSGATVLFDTPVFIYHAEDHPSYYVAADALLARVRGGDLRGLASVLVLTELLVPYYRASRREHGRRLANALRDFPNFELISVSPRIAQRAAELRARHSLHTPDAIHLATALERHADWIVTNDHHLRRAESEGIRVWLFDDPTSTDSR